MLHVHVIPNARTDGVAGQYGDAIKIKLRAPAVEGKANGALIRFLADHLKLPRHSIELERGHASRDKLIRIHGANLEEARSRLLASIPRQSQRLRL